MQKVIEVMDVTKTFKLSKKQQKINNTREKTKIAVNGLSFSAYEGEIYGLLGSNGAGKTTTLRMLSTLIKPDSGTLYVDGFDVVKDSLMVRSKIGFLTSDLKLEDFFTPNYLFDFYSDLHNIDPETREKRKEVLFNTFEITDFKEVKIGDLSTGMRQKASLAISLASDPKIIIFDEPTNGLDVLTAKIVTDFLLSLKEQKYTIILSTHIFSLVEKVCDRIGIMVDGRVVLEGELKELTKEESLEDVFFTLYVKYQGEEQ